MTTAPTTAATSSVATERSITPREAYERGASLTALRKWFHLSESEARDVAPEEFADDDDGRDKVSGY